MSTLKPRRDTSRNLMRLVEQADLSLVWETEDIEEAMTLAWQALEAVEY